MTKNAEFFLEFGTRSSENLFLSWETQQLIGSLNDVGQMCPFLRGFRQPLYNFLMQFHDNQHIKLSPPSEVRSDLKVWAAAMHTISSGFPIPPRPSEHLPSAIMFVSDASGAQFAKTSEKFITLPYEGERGAASINAIEESSLSYAFQIFLLVKR
jgi:hypothetical protein